MTRQRIFDHLYKVDWKQLDHAYGPATDAPAMIRCLLFADSEEERRKGLDAYFGCIRHQGDYYDSTVAAVPIFLAALAHSSSADVSAHARATVLSLLLDIWQPASNYGGDPWLVDPPDGSENIPTPMLSDDEAASAEQADLEQSLEEDDGPAAADAQDLCCQESGRRLRRRMDLCAWQAAKAVEVGIPTYQALLQELDPKVVTAAANLLMLWRSTRSQAQVSLMQLIDAANSETDENDKEAILQTAGLVLHLCVYGPAGSNGINTADSVEDHLKAWSQPHQPLALRAAAALGWARQVEPSALSKEAREALEVATEPNCSVLQDLPKVGIYEDHIWNLPSNSSWVRLKLLENEVMDLRWRAAQSFIPTWVRDQSTISDMECVPRLVELVQDTHGRIRNAAIVALLGRDGQVCMDHVPNLPTRLLDALSNVEAEQQQQEQQQSMEDAPMSRFRFGLDEGTTGHIARLLAKLSPYMSSDERALAVDKLSSMKHTGMVVETLSRGGSSARNAQAVVQEARQLIQSHQGQGQTPRVWTLEEMIRQYVSSDEANEKLAEAYKITPAETIRTAVRIIRPGPFGYVPDWLGTLGATAAPYLKELKPMVTPSFLGKKNKVDILLEHVAEEVKFSNASKPWELTRILAGGLDVAALDAMLRHPNACVRAAACDALAERVVQNGGEQLLTTTMDTLVELLGDETVAQFGIEGPFEYRGRWHQWRREVFLPCGSASAACLAATKGGKVPPLAKTKLLKAMLVASKTPKLRVYNGGLMHTFALTDWERAVQAFGGLEVAAPKIALAKTETNITITQDELLKVLGGLSGRLT